MTEIAIDTVRASRAGHQYHEAWLARRALGLLMPRDGLCGIAVEGLSQDLEDGAKQAVIEIADATFFYGGAPSFEEATKIDIAQFKYSIARASADLRFADVKKTVQKFCASEKSFIEKYGETQTWAKIGYSIVTNRPISPALAEAFAGAAEGRVPADADAASQFKALCGEVELSAERVSQFCARVVLSGSAGALNMVERGNAAIIADWSASRDVIARARLGDLRELIKNKAGPQGQSNKLVVKVDILAALDLSEESDLLPTPQAFPEVGAVVERLQLADFLSKVSTSSGRWLIHAAGGVGKTVFAQSLASKMKASDEVVIFDCFGGGAYRSPIDGRHRPERGLLHIVNELACRGLCDPILPGVSDPAEVIRRSIQRFSQAIDVIRRTRPLSRLVIVLDAADNAALEAADRGQQSFPKDLLESLTHLSPIEGLVVIATARTERRELAIGAAACSPYQLEPFASSEAESFIVARRPEATPAQIDAITRRADGNPRVIANLIEPDRSLASEAEIPGKVKLDSLIEQRIERATKLADEKGARPKAIAAFLCALSRLPPPVPIAEIAAAFGFQQSEIESLAADLSPLLERTRHGLVFRDEPTETLVNKRYGTQIQLLNDVAARLNEAQTTSVYAARALPGLLFAMGRARDLHTLAFDTRFPPELDSDVAKRAIRLNRFTTALAASARSRDFDAAVDLLVELSSIVLGDERGEDFLLENPDLVVALADSETLRRLFEARTSWPGTRHARLTIAYVTDGDTGEAYGQGVRTEEWLKWSTEQDTDDPIRRTVQPEVDDRIAIPFYLLAKQRFVDAGAYLARYHEWYAYQMATRLFELCVVAQSHGKLQILHAALDKLSQCRATTPALVAAAFTSIQKLDAKPSKRLLVRLAAGLRKQEELGDTYSQYREQDSYVAALQRCAMRAARLGLKDEASAIHKVVSPQRYNFYTLRDPFHTEYIGPWILTIALHAAIEGRPVTLLDCLPIELFQLLDGHEIPQSDDDLEKILLELIKPPPSGSSTSNEPKRRQLSGSELQRVPDAIRQRIRPLREPAERLMTMLTATSESEANQATAQFFDSWEAEQKTEETYDAKDRKRYLNALYTFTAFQAFTGLGLLDGNTAPRFAECLARCEFPETRRKIEMVRQLAQQPDAHEYAGRMAVEAVKGIQLEDEVTTRSSLFARLARALFPADRSEAAALFKRGLSELDALGSGDYEFTNEILSFSASLRTPLASQAAHRLAKICELNNYDSRKFPWPLCGKAFSRAWGLRYLAQIARWDDRDKADLEYTLPPALTFLIRDGLLPAEQAVPLFNLVDVTEMWDWGWPDIFASLVQVKASPALFELVLAEYEANHPSGCYYRLDDVRKAIEKEPAILERVAPTLDRLEGVMARRRQVDRNSYGAATPQQRSVLARNEEVKLRLAAEATAEVDPVNATSLEALVEKLEEIDDALDTKRRAFSQLRSRLPYGDRVGHIEAIVATRNLDLFAKNTLLQDAKEQWLSESPSGLDIFKRIGPMLVREHAQELVSSNWGFNWELNKLTELSGEPRSEWAVTLAETATSRGLTAAPTTWLNLATLLSPMAAPSIPTRALERLLGSGAARLADDVGDGGWRPELDSGDDPAKVTAGLVWYCLGSPHAAQRWRAAHVVRELAQAGRWHVIGEIAALFDGNGAGSFQDQNLPFFIYHARLWFLLAVARLASDFPDRVAVFRPLLERIATDDAFPHAALREAARRGLLVCLSLATDPASAALKAKLAGVNQSKFPRPKKQSRVAYGSPWNRPADVPRPDFGFEYDFEKYDLNELGRIFGLPQWEIGARCAAQVRKWEKKVKSMYDFGGRRKRGDTNDYRLGTEDNYHSFGTYLAWHAMAVVGGKLLLERPIDEVRSYEDPWKEWLHKYSITRSDGLWLSDGTVKYPFIALNDLMRDNGKDELPTSDRAVLLSLAGIGNDLRIGKELSVSASWSSPDKVHVHIMSALVPGAQANLVVRALATSAPFHMWLPTFRYYDDDDDFNADEYAPAEAWISSGKAYVRLDDDDPRGTKAALERYRPALRIKRRFRLVSKDPWSARWMRPQNRPAFTAEAWGIHSGTGRSEHREQGNALSVDTKLLTQILQKLNRSLVLLVKLEHYREKQGFDEHGSGGDFTHSWLIGIIDQSLNLVVLHEATTADLRTVARLPEHDRSSFRERMRALGNN